MNCKLRCGTYSKEKYENSWENLRLRIRIRRLVRILQMQVTVFVKYAC